MLRSIPLLLPFLSLAAAQSRPTEECPILGPSLPSDFDLSQTKAFNDAKAAFPEVIQSLFESEAVDPEQSSFAIDVFSTKTNSSIYSYYHAGPGLNGTLTTGELNDGTIMRIGSVSKLFTVYAIIAHSGLGVLDHPVTNYLPELMENSQAGHLERINWEDVTVGALSSHQGGSGGFPTEFITCYYEPGGCTVQQLLSTMSTRKHPVAPPFEVPLYSDAGFGVLGRVLERLTGLSYGDALQSVLGTPLGLNDTSTVKPTSEGFNGLIIPGDPSKSAWGFDNQITAPSGGVYSSNANLRTLGLSILHSQLLSPAATRAWMKPRGNTASIANAVGAPWEIARLALPVTPASNRTRISDLYTKLGGQSGYGTVFALSPDHGLGYVVQVAGAGALAALAERFALRDAVGEVFLLAAEHAAVENAAENIAGDFVADGQDGTNLTLSVDADRPGLGLASWFVNGSEWRANLTGPAQLAENISVRLYPTGLESVREDGVVRRSFRALAQDLPTSPPSSGVAGGGAALFDYCQSWLSVDLYLDPINGYGLDEFVLEFVKGTVVSVENPASGTVVRRVEQLSSF